MVVVMNALFVGGLSILQQNNINNAAITNDMLFTMYLRLKGIFIRARRDLCLI